MSDKEARSFIEWGMGILKGDAGVQEKLSGMNHKQQKIFLCDLLVKILKY